MLFSYPHEIARFKCRPALTVTHTAEGCYIVLCTVRHSKGCLQVEKVQHELDGLAATLKQVELYNEQMKGEIAVTRRYAAVITLYHSLL